MKIIVTGGAGFIASNVADEYINQGHQIATIDNLVTGHTQNLNPKAKFYQADILDLDALKKIFTEFKPDVVNHHAAQISVRESVKEPKFDANTNILGTINILECCKEFKCKLIYASSGGARYGEPQYLPCDEKHPVKPICPYGISKHSAEHYIELYHTLHGLQYNIIAYANVYGPRQDPQGEAGVVSIFTDRMLQNKECLIFGDGEQTRDFVYVGDVARANVLALNFKNKLYNIGTGKPTSINQIFHTIKQATGSKTEEKHGPNLPGDIRHVYLSNELAKKELGWEPKIDLTEGILRTIEWAKNRLN